MPDKIVVIKMVDEEGREQFTVCAPSLPDLANMLGVTKEQFVVEEDNKLARQRRLPELNRRNNTPEAIRKRTDFNPFDY
jgi:hypothetical protein